MGKQDNIMLTRTLQAGSLVIWALLILLPLSVLLVHAANPAVVSNDTAGIHSSFLRSFALAALISAVAVILGYVPGRLLGTTRHRDILLLLLLMPLVLPRYVQYYAWTLLLSPTTELGKFFMNRPELARFVGGSTAALVLILWYWPLAALLIAQGFRNIDRAIWDCASLDASNGRVFGKLTLPLLAPTLLFAFAVCFVLTLSEFTTFHLAGISTVGTELAILYQQTASEAVVARAAWPVIIVAVVVAFALARHGHAWQSQEVPLSVESSASRRQWFLLLPLLAVSLLIPLALLIVNAPGYSTFAEFFTLHSENLLWSLAVSAVAALLAHAIAYAALSLKTVSTSNSVRHVNWPHVMKLIVHTTIFLAMLLPASLMAVAFLRLLTSLHLPSQIRQGWYIVSAGQAVRFAGVALIVLLLARSSHHRQLSEAAMIDGASAFQTWLHVHLPRTWPLLAGSFILVIMLGVTELSATMVLLPAGLPNFAQSLLNQMHYVLDKHVIVSSLMLTGTFLVLAAIVVTLLRASRIRRSAVLVSMVLVGLILVGCDEQSGDALSSDGPEVLAHFGSTGRGQAEFIYPRAIELDDAGRLSVIDKTGRVQAVTTGGDFIDSFDLPKYDAGFPTGLSLGPDGNIYVADTHCHRVAVFSPAGELVNEFGRFGEEDGCFIYPTDVTFSSDGRIFVSEYGGNDRISVFDSNGTFKYTFGAPGDGDGQFSRPSALSADNAKKCLYIADACNHRIAVYDFDGRLIRYIGSVGTAEGQLRYPYDIDLLDDGTIVVCEYGNNRIQLFSPDGRSIAAHGTAGRQLGQLAYPWGVAVDKQRRAFIVDAGNDRIQVWQL